MPDKENDGKNNNTDNSSRGILSVQNNREFESMLEEKFNAVFVVNKQKHKFTKKSLFCLDSHSKFRRIFVRIMVNKWFERFIIVCIVVNSLLLASK